MTMRRVAALVLLVACIVATSRSVQAQPRGGADAGASSGRMAPTEEHSVSAPADSETAANAGDRPAAENPENLEERLYLRDRPDVIGRAVQERENEMLTRLLRDREGLVVARRNQAIELLEQFVQSEPEEAAEMPDALLRLAELRWELAREAYLHAFEAWQAVPETNRSSDPPRADYSVPVALYDRILTRHRNFPRYDFVIYMKAFAMVDSGRIEDALALYRRILTEFPNSSFVPDAHMAFAESYFNGNYDYPRALAEYEEVLRHRESELYDIALFKSAWCLWRMGRAHDAATRFRQVLDLGQNAGELTTVQRRRLQELQEEALNYLIQVFTEDEQNTARDVFRFLQEIGGERYAQRVLTRLSATFYDQARYDRGIDAYTILIELEPSSPDAAEWQHQIAVGYGALDDAPHTIEALRVLATTYSADSTWASQQGDPEIVASAVRTSERALRQQALRYHELAQRGQQRPKFELAANLYKIYLEHFPNSSSVYEMRFYLAEILFHRLEQYDEAGEQYLLAARANHQGRYTRDALYNAIGAFEHVREVEIARCRGTAAPAANGAHAAATPTPAPATPAATPATEAACGESENDRKFGEAIELYVQLFPNDPDLPEILFRQGKLYYDNAIFDPAVRLWGQLIERFPNSPYSSQAGELILDSFNRAQDYANIERWARRLKNAPAFQSPSSQARLDGLILQSVFKIGEQLATRGEHAEAANAYFRAAEEFPRDARARQAYFNAGVERQRAGDLAGAAQAYDRLIERHPGSTEGALGAWTAAQMYESIAQFSDAARYYEQYVARFPQGEKAADAGYNAVLLRVTAGDNDEAVGAGQEFVRRFPRHESVDDVYFLIGRAHEANEDWSEAAQTYREYIRRSRNNDRKVEAQTRLGQVLLRAGDARQADQAFDAAVALGRRFASSLHDGLYYAAQARYLQGDAVLAEFAEIHIEGDVAGLRSRLERKSQLLQRAAGIYSDCVEFHVAEWVTASLFQIGRSYELFAESLRGAPVPEGLNEEETQSYQDQLASFVVPIEERALEAFEGGYRKALELHIFNAWTARLREALTRLNDVEYPPLREIGGETISATPLPVPQALTGLRRQAEEGPAITPPASTTPGINTTSSSDDEDGDAPASAPAAGNRNRGRR